MGNFLNEICLIKVDEDESSDSGSSDEPSDTEDAIDKKNESNEIKPSQNGNAAKELENGNVDHQTNTETPSVNGTPPGHEAAEPIQQNSPKNGKGKSPFFMFFLHVGYWYLGIF